MKLEDAIARGPVKFILDTQPDQKLHTGSKQNAAITLYQGRINAPVKPTSDQQSCYSTVLRVWLAPNLMEAYSWHPDTARVRSKLRSTNFYEVSADETGCIEKHMKAIRGGWILLVLPSS